MVGDDIISDVGGAQACGIRGIQVRTGKYRFWKFDISVTVPFCLPGKMAVSKMCVFDKIEDFCVLCTLQHFGT